MFFDICDLDFDPMTLILKPDPDMMMTYIQTIHDNNKSNGSKAIWL